MPQMAPLNWVSLYFFFIFLLIMLMINNYFIYNYLPKTNKSSINLKMNNWKW